MIDELVNIDEVKDVSRIKLHYYVANIIAEENLNEINLKSEVVLPKNSIYTKYVKRIFDIVIAICALIVTFPINIIIGVCTYFSLGSPIFFQEKRLGRNNKTFVITKFRNMTNEKDENDDLLPPNKRVTKLGKFLRKTSLDELLNFWSILKGDMSVIGPRPLQPVYLDRYCERHKSRTLVKPGLECPSIYKKRLDSWSEQFENDIYYIENLSFFLDMKMFFLLIRMVFDKKVREQSASGIRGGFMGYNSDGSSIQSTKTPKRYVDKAIQKAQAIQKGTI